MNRNQLFSIIAFIIAIIFLTSPQIIPIKMTKRNKHITGIVSLLIAYYYFNNEKLF